MRPLAIALALALTVWSGDARAQTWRPDAIGSAYTYGAPPGAPAAYGDQRGSVVLLDGSPARIPMTQRMPGVASPVDGIYPATATAPIFATSPEKIGQPGQQFQLLDAAPPPASPIVYSTMPPPSLPPGAIVPDLIDHCCDPWEWQLLPPGLIWHSYLAGPKEPRFGGTVADDTGMGTKFDGTLGGRVGLLRYGNRADFRPQGWQLDLEGAALIRQDLSQNSDVDGYDFRVGIPITYGWGPYQMKFAWYHTSAHLGDEFALKHPDFVRINYTRNAFVWGHSLYVTDDLRIYGEIEYAYDTDGGAEPWAFQFGFEYSPVVRGWHGAPFFAINAWLRQENDFGGPLTVETGWQWRGQTGGQLMRVGFYYQTGPSMLFEFFRDSEQLIGAGMWYDF